MKYRTAEASLSVSPPGSAEAKQESIEGALGVPAASRMIELMEIAAARLMRARLRDGETSVAVSMNVTYAAPNLRRSPGGTMRAVALDNGISGRLHRFKINAFDESGLIGTAEHTRAVVIERRLVSIARQRAAEPGMLVMM